MPPKNKGTPGSQEATPLVSAATQDPRFMCSVCGATHGRQVLLCDASNCSGRACLTCTGLSSPPAGDWFCKQVNCSGKRPAEFLLSTPPPSTKQKTLSPQLQEKVLALARSANADLPAFPGAGSSSSSGQGTGVEAALVTLGGKIDAMHRDMVTLEALQSVKHELLRQFEEQIGKLEAKFLELETANVELRSRVDALETKLSNLTSGPDPAFKRLSFLGFESGSDLDRIAHVSSFMSTHFSGISVSVGNIMRGPRSARVLTKIVYAEFCDSDVRNAVLSQIRSRSLTCQFGGKSIAVKPALSQIVRQRIWALNKAHELVKAHPAAVGKEVLKVNGKDGGITVDGVSAFTQSGVSGFGVFAGVFSTLVLPCR